MSLLGWIVIGVVAGWLASAVVSAPRSGCFWNLVIGLLGALAGGLIFEALSDETFDFEFDIKSLGVATLGAIVLLLLVNLVTSRRRRA